VPGEDEDADTNPPSLETMQSFVCYEDLFDELTEIHGVDHCKGRTFYNQCKEKYANVTQEVTKLFIDTCQLCVKSMPRKKPTPGHTPILTLGFGSRGQVDLIDFQNLPDGEFKFLMNYTDAGEKFGWSIQKKIGAWMSENNSPHWSIGCKICMWRYNTQIHRTLGSKSPYHLVFGQLPRAGIF
jgi:hypothetical protein